MESATYLFASPVSFKYADLQKKPALKVPANFTLRSSLR